MRIVHGVILGVLLGGWTGPASVSPAQDLEPSLRALTGQPAVARTRVGVVVADLHTRAVLLDHHGDELFIPASNMKLVTAAAALEFLGGDHVFFTRLETHGKVVNGVLQGDLVVVGNGDPRFGAPGAPDQPESWAAKVRALGIRRVRGDLVLVEQDLDRCYRHPDWSDYNAASLTARPVAALGFGENVVVVSIRPGPRIGAPGRLSVHPDVGQVVLTNRTRTVSGRSRAPWFQRAPNAREVIVNAGVNVKRRSSLDGAVAVPDPPRFLGRCLRQALAGAGVTLEGGIVKRDRTADPTVRVVAEHRVRLVDLLEPCLKESDNRIAEILFKAAGAAFLDEPGDIAAGGRAAAAVLKRAEATGSEAVYRDGSGLSRKNRLSPRQLVDLLMWTLRRPYGEAFAQALAQGGEPNTTLRSRFQEDPLRTCVRAKTGYLHGARALSGYLRVGPKRVWVFSILINGSREAVQPTRAAMDQFIRSVWKAAVRPPRR